MKKTVKTITIWSDYACPYCYIGEKRLHDAVKELGVEDQVKFEYRAFELNPDLPVHSEGDIEGRLAAKYGLTKEEARKKIDEIDSLGKEVGLDMNYGKAKVSNTFDAHRLMKFAETEYEPAIYETFNTMLFKAYFTDHKPLTDRRLLLDIAEACAIDGNQAKEVLDQGLYADQVRYDEEEARMRGIRGVPYMVFDGQFAVPGAISTEDCKKVVKEMLGLDKGTPNGVKGASCDENGCAL